MKMFREKQRDITITENDLKKFEKSVSDIYETGTIRGPVHLSDGNESYLIDLFQYIHPDDWVCSTWRNHYHSLLHGVPEAELMDKILQGRSISFQSPEHHVYTSAIVNGILPIAVGTALGMKWKNDEGCKKRDERRKKGFLSDFWRDTRMVWCFVGDMTASSGIFYESLKYSVLNELPIRFIVESNQLSTNSPTALSWGLHDPADTTAISAAWSWMNESQREKYVSYFEYKRGIYPHVGCGTWVSF